MPKQPSPCLDVCKFKREGHCTACSMTKKQKSEFKSLSKKKRGPFIQMLVRQQDELGGYEEWSVRYEKKCRKKGWKPEKAA